MPKSLFTDAKSAMLAYFDASSRKAYSETSLKAILNENREKWGLSEKAGPRAFINYLEKYGSLAPVELSSEEYGIKTRYIWKDFDPYSVAVSIREKAYCSHASAIFLHGLSNLIPNTIYVNAEQSPKPPPSGEMTQVSIDRSFAKRQRSSNYIFDVESYSIVILSGKNTNNLGVVEHKSPNDNTILVTDIERTLIDCAVRPGYAGGLQNVLEAYQNAMPRVSINRLRAHLKKLDHKYPYHQSIGYLMKRAGYASSKLQILRDLGINFNFHLDYGIKDPDYDSEWRVFVPKGL